MDAAQLRTWCEEVRREWDQVLAELGDEGLEHPGALGTWRVRDVLAHLNGWERWQLVQLRCAFSGEEPTDEELCGGVAFPPNDSFDVESMNAMFVEGNRARPRSAVVADWRENWRLRESFVASASEELLATVIGSDWSGSPRVLRLAAEVPTVVGQERVWERIADQVGHQWAHLELVRAWMD